MFLALKWLNFDCAEFPTSRLEMNVVANIFDRCGESYIDWKEFLAALRSDWEEPGQLCDADKIHDEVQRHVEECTCNNKLNAHQVSEGKFRVSNFLS